MWLSLVERRVRDAEVAGSNPVISTTRALTKVLFFSSQSKLREPAVSSSPSPSGYLNLKNSSERVGASPLCRLRSTTATGSNPVKHSTYNSKHIDNSKILC